MIFEKISIKELQKLIDESGANWIAGETPISRLPTNELLRHFGAILPGGDEERKERERISRENYDAWKSHPPASRKVSNTVDWRAYTEPIKYQGNCSACVSFAVIATAEALYKIQWENSKYSIDYSEADLFFCNSGNCTNGQNINTAINAFVEKGVVDEACYKYKDKDMACKLCDSHDWRWTKIRVINDNVTGIPEIQDQLQRGPVAAIFSVYEDFVHYTGGIYSHVTGRFIETHAVSIVGYNDDEKYWICKNSWGEKFGEKGYFRISYGQCGIDSNVWSIADVGMSERHPNMEFFGLLGITRANEKDIEYGGALFKDDIGWRTIRKYEDVDLSLLSVIISAKSKNRKVNISIENGEIDAVSIKENASGDENEQPGSGDKPYYDDPTLRLCMETKSNASIGLSRKDAGMDEKWYNGTIISIDTTGSEYYITIKLHGSKEKVRRPLYGASETSTTVLTMLAGHAFRDSRRIDARERDGKIDAMYVWSCK